ncbi:hypothetical protein D3C73_567500 [compost metagenome]
MEEKVDYTELELKLIEAEAFLDEAEKAYSDYVDGLMKYNEVIVAQKKIIMEIKKRMEDQLHEQHEFKKDGRWILGC